MVGFIDLARPERDRTHIGRFFERVGRDGFRGFWTVIERKAALVFEVFSNPWVVLLIVFLLVLVTVAGRWWWKEVAPSVEPTLPTLRPMLIASAIVAVLGFALNDSGIVVPGTMLAVLVPALIALTPGPRLHSGVGYGVGSGTNSESIDVDRGDDRVRELTEEA